MKRFISIIAIAMITISAAAQSEAGDSIQFESGDSIKSSVSLDEVVIQAPKVIRKADMDVYHPSQSALENSKNGMQLLKNLMIPSLTVNDMMETITKSGESVQVRINGREASIEEVKQLLPESIKRVEWIDNPGLRYNGANAVLNFIVVNPELGGSLMAQAVPALNTAWGAYNGSIKLNNGRSQWGASTFFKLSNHIPGYRDYDETITTPDNTTYERHEESIDGGYISDTFGGVRLDYSYIKPDTTVFWVALHGYKQWPSSTYYTGVSSDFGKPGNVLLQEFDSSNGFTPSFAAYLEQHLPNKQLIAIDLRASLYNGRARRSYKEIDDEGDGDILTDINTSIKDRNQSYNIVANYIKNWASSRLTLGVNYKANRNRSVYENLDDAVFHQRQDGLYFFGEYYQRINKVTLTAGVGAQYSSFKFRESDQGSNSWNFRPKFTITFRPDQHHNVRLDFTSWQSAPSLSETNVVSQQVDEFQWTQGNPDLSTSSSYRMSLRYNYDLKKFSGTFGVEAFASPDAITPYKYWAGNKLITSYENSEGLQKLAFWIAPSMEVIPGWLWVNGSLLYKVERMEGTGYRRYNHNWSGDISANLSHWGWQLMVQYVRAQRNLFGENLTWGEDFSMITLDYNWKNWQFGAGIMCPFTKYDQGQISYNRYNSYEKHMRIERMPMPFVSISYNLQWGKQRRDAQKLVNADGEVSKSSTAGK